MNKPKERVKSLAIATLLLISCALALFAQEKPGASVQELADKLSNPVASLISVPFQNNLDYGIGGYNGSKYTLNFQPVVPLPLNQKLNLVMRLVLPIIDQRDVTGEHSYESGLSDATLTGFFAPANSKNGIIWGAGPAFLIPTGTNDFLSTKKWGAGPSLLALKQVKGLTLGFLANQLWSFAGDQNRSDVNQMFLQPFFSKSFKSGASITLNSEITFNWEAGTTSASLNPLISGVTKLGKQTVQLGIGPRIPLGGPAASRPDWGLRAGLTLVFPK